MVTDHLSLNTNSQFPSEQYREIKYNKKQDYQISPIMDTGAIYYSLAGLFRQHCVISKRVEGKSLG